MAVGLTGGTTATELARALAGKQQITIVTNALNIASELGLRPNLKLIVTGGLVRSRTYELSGPLAEASLVGLNLDVAFIGVEGVSANAGFTTHHEVEAHTNRALVRAADRVVVVADSSKLGKRGFARICDVATASDIVTDSAADPRAVAELERLGPTVHVVDAG
jgi:DeoR family transcriptional regulator of aga operon